MSTRNNDAAQLVVEAMALRPPGERAFLLCEIMAHAAAGLTVITGPQDTAEKVYRLADAIVSRAQSPAVG